MRLPGVLLCEVIDDFVKKIWYNFSLVKLFLIGLNGSVCWTGNVAIRIIGYGKVREKERKKHEENHRGRTYLY